jgi:hypothetical protein
LSEMVEFEMMVMIERDKTNMLDADVAVTWML